MSQYRSTVQAATRFAAGEREGTRLEWEQQMRQAAGELAFERAASLKQRLERAKELDHTAYRLVRPVERFSWLIVQRGRGRTRIKPFFVRGGRLQPGEVTGLKDLDHAVASWMERLRADVSDRQPDQDDPQVRSESIWLVSHFLFRRDPPGLFFEASRLPETHALVQSILEHFAITRPEPSSPGELTPERADRLREGQ